MKIVTSTLKWLWRAGERQRRTSRVALLAMALAISGGSTGRAHTEQIVGVVHESAPATGTVVAEARVAVSGAPSSATAATAMTNNQGRFTLDAPPTAGLVLEVTHPAYETATVTLDDTSRAHELEIRLTPAAGKVFLSRSGTNDCVDLPKPPAGVPGLREYARIAVHHDGIVTVNSAQLPFFNNPGYVYRQKSDGWEPNESDYVLLRSPIPVLGGFVYVITFGGDKDLCGPWSIDATHPR